MEEGRKRVLAIVAGILVARKLAQFEGICPGSPREELINHAMQICNSILRDQFRGSAAIRIAGAFDPDGRTAPAATRLEGLLGRPGIYTER